MKNSINNEINIPEHVAIIMDGNGRWAKKRHLPRVFGHREGMENVRKIAIAASNAGIKILTLYSFSTENWNRPKDEVDFLMKLPVTFFNKFVPELIERNVVVKITGFLDHLPKDTLKSIIDAQEDTKNNTGMILNFAFNYGSKAEIVNATKEIAKDILDGKLQLSEINDSVFSEHLLTHFGKLNNVDFLIRTSGEKRISNFLLWQIAYAELYFTDSYWPDFKENNLLEAIRVYQERDRRYGKL